MLSYLAGALAALGLEVTVLTSQLDVEQLPAQEDVPGPLGSFSIVRLATSKRRFAGTYLYMYNLRRWLTANPPDIAYVSMLKHDAHVAVSVGEVQDFPVVLRPEGAGDTGDIAWHVRGRFGKRIADRCKRATAFVAISDAVRGELISAGFDEGRIVDIPNGVRIPAQPWLAPECGQNAPRAVFVGRLATEKGVDTLLRAWRIVLEAHPGAVLELAGSGPEHRPLQNLAGQLGLGDSVRFLGVVPDAEPQLRNSDVFVLPSREEGMSMALLEAMALGIPVVASRIPGNCRLIEDSKQGSLFAVDDPAALARAILNVFTEPHVAADRGRAARALVENAYSIHAVALAHRALFEKLLAEKRGADRSNA